MKTKKSLSIGTKLLLFISISVALSIALVVVAALIQISNYNDTTSRQQAVEGMEGFSSKIGELKLQALQLAKVISANPDLSQAVGSQNSDAINHALAGISSDVDFISVTDSQGNVIMRTHAPDQAGDNIKNQKNIEVALAGEPYATIEDGTIMKLSVRAGAPIKNNSGHIVGAISLGFRLEKEALADNIKKLYNTDVTLFDGDIRLNTTILKDGKRLVGTKLDPKIADKVIKNNERYIGNYEILGLPYVCAYMPLRDSENHVIGVIFSGKPLEEVIKVRNNIIYSVVTISIIVLLLLMFLLYLFVSKGISRPLKYVVNAAEKIAEGDLDVQVKVGNKDEIGLLSSSFNKMAQNLNEVISYISIASDQVTAGSRQVSDSSMALSQGATEQASAIEELTASLDEISSKTKANAESANQANNFAEDARTYANQGNQQMQQMLKAMDEINVASSNISKIIKVIDEIAFQTNILALNAAVEAARAGQHGKGFAVVAEEVRNLAARSANAAKETTALIEGSVKKVEGGTKIAVETAEALKSIVGGITKVAGLVEGIASASNEQATGIAQINQGIMQVSQVVQTNSATSEESASASEELASQAEMLKEQVARFKLKRVNQTGYINKTHPGEERSVSKKPHNIVLGHNDFGKY